MLAGNDENFQTDSISKEARFMLQTGKRTGNWCVFMRAPARLKPEIDHHLQGPRLVPMMRWSNNFRRTQHPNSTEQQTIRFSLSACGFSSWQLQERLCVDESPTRFHSCYWRVQSPPPPRARSQQIGLQILSLSPRPQPPGYARIRASVLRENSTPPQYTHTQQTHNGQAAHAAA